MSDVEVFVDLPDARTVRAGLLSFDENQAGILLSTRFEYDPRYLTHPGAYGISPELPLRRGPQHAAAGSPMIGAFADSQPDRWGRNLMFAARRHRARAAGERLHQLTERDYLLGVRDATRQGALRFSTDGGQTFLGQGDDGVPDLVDLPELVDAARRVVQRTETERDISVLLAAGTSMGGARPKTSVITDEGRLAIAKLPSPDDLWDVLAWEAVALELARRSGIETPHFQHVRVGESRSVLVVDRFDRTDDGGRVGYLSARSFMMQGPHEVVFYTDLAERLATEGARPQRDAEELFRRVALTLLLNNVDDHMRNHGLVRASSGWRMSPVFDVNPFPGGGAVDSTPLSPDDSGVDRDVRHLLETADSYRMTEDRARAVLGAVARAVDGWADVAQTVGLDHEDVGYMSTAFDADALTLAKDLGQGSDGGKQAVLPIPAPAASARKALSRGSAGDIWVPPHVRNGRRVGGYFRRRAR